jgi:hypothetical protein
MYHDAGTAGYDVSTMSHDASLGVATTVTQADLAWLRSVGRLGEFAVVYRTWRQQAGGGFGRQEEHPFTWGVLVYVDGVLARVYSVRGAAREWTSLDRLERWLRQQGFRYWWTRNDLEATALEETDGDHDAVRSEEPDA